MSRKGRSRKDRRRKPCGRLACISLQEINRPTDERFRQGEIERLKKPISDDDGRPVQPLRTVSLLSAMERRAAITADMRVAAEDFQARFFAARLDRVGAANLVRTSRSSVDETAPRVYAARKNVWRDICAVGGLASPGGSCLWNVIGFEQPLKEWALEQEWNGRGGISIEIASNILIMTLGRLEEHYR